MTVFQLRAVAVTLEPLREQLVQLRPLDALRVPRVDLAPVDHELLGRDVLGGELAHHLRRRLRAEERDEVARRVLRDLAERVARDDGGELLPASDEHLDLEPESVGELSLECLLQARAGERAREDHVAALEVRAHVLVAVAGEQLAQVGHADAPAAAEVDPAQRGRSTATLARVESYECRLTFPAIPAYRGGLFRAAA